MPPDITKKPPQDEIDRVIARRLDEQRKRHDAQIEQLTSELESFRTVNEAAKARVAELETALSSVTTERETLRAQLDETTAQHTQVFGELSQRHERTVAEHRHFRADHTLTQALVAANVLTSATRHALNIMRAESEIEQDDSGAVRSITWNGQRHEKPEDAAKAFLHVNDHFASAGIVIGGGTETPNWTGWSVTPKAADPVSLAQEGWNKKP